MAPPDESVPDVKLPESVLWLTVTDLLKIAPPEAPLAAFVEFPEKVLRLTTTKPLLVEVATAPPSASTPVVEFPETVL
jgi:hypothetical protein